MSDLELLSARLDQHTREDHDNFTAIRESLEKIDTKLDTISEKTIKLEVVQNAAAKAGAISGSRWSAIVAIAISGLYTACSWINGQY